jgi:hypothetical protein
VSNVVKLAPVLQESSDILPAENLTLKRHFLFAEELHSELALLPTSAERGQEFGVMRLMQFWHLCSEWPSCQ